MQSKGLRFPSAVTCGRQVPYSEQSLYSTGKRSVIHPPQKYVGINHQLHFLRVPRRIVRKKLHYVTTWLTVEASGVPVSAKKRLPETPFRDTISSMLFPVGILGTGSILPTLRVTAEDLDARLSLPEGTSFARNGIRARHFANDQETTSAMSTQAICRALNSAGLHAQDLDAIIFSGVMSEQPMPSTATSLSSSNVTILIASSALFYSALERTRSTVSLYRSHITLFVLVLPPGLLPDLTAGFTGLAMAITRRCGFLCGRNVGDSPAERSSPSAYSTSSLLDGLKWPCSSPQGKQPVCNRDGGFYIQCTASPKTAISVEMSIRNLASR